MAQRLVASTPSACALCRAWPAEPICDACRTSFTAARHRCASCAAPLPAGAPAQCGACLINSPPIASCVAAVDYGYPWAELVTQFKFSAQPGWARVFAQLMRAAPGAQELLANADVLLPIPLSRERLRQRGYNQALLLAQQLAAFGGTPAVHARQLLRLHDTPAQSELGRAERLRNLRGAFALEPLAAPALAGKRVLLIDDVMTTGATLHAASAVLRTAGVQDVSALVLARTRAPQER